MLEEVGQPYRVEMLDYGTTMKAPTFLAINPSGRVPVLLVAGEHRTEVAALQLHLAERHPPARLAPAPRAP